MNRINVALLRGAFLNPNELANYEQLSSKINLNSFSSQKPLGKSKKIKNQSLFCPFDYPYWGMTKFIFNRSLGDSHWLFGLEKRLKNYQIIDTADPYYYYSYQATIFKQTHPKIKLVSTYWETKPFNNEGTQAKKRNKYLTIKQVDRFIVHTLKSRDCLIQEGANPNKISLVRLGVDLKKFNNGYKTNHQLLFVGRLVYEKGVWQLYQVFKELIKKYPRLKLRLVGEGPLKSKIITDCKQNNLQTKVDICSLPYSKISQAYHQTQIFILPSQATSSWEEQYAMVLIEAMASGLPIVTTNCGAIPEVVDNCALIGEQHSLVDLYKNIQLLLNNPNQQQQMSQKGRQRARMYFDRNQFAATIENIYEELIDRYSG